MKFDLSFTNKEITPWEEWCFKANVGQNRFREQIEKCESLPVSLSNNSYKKRSFLFESFITSIWCGANRFCTQKLPVQIRLLGKYLTGGKPLLQDGYINAILASLHNTSTSKLGIIFQLVFQNLNLNYFTLDIDSSVITRYGEQEGAKGYNPKKKEETAIILSLHL